MISYYIILYVILYYIIIINIEIFKNSLFSGIISIFQLVHLEIFFFKLLMASFYEKHS